MSLLLPLSSNGRSIPLKSKTDEQVWKKPLVDHYLLEEVNERIVGHFPGNISFLPGGKRLQIKITSSTISFKYNILKVTAVIDLLSRFGECIC